MERRHPVGSLPNLERVLWVTQRAVKMTALHYLKRVCKFR